ncbi:MAG: hypothetical protein V9H69_21915 [Anaerolineae bacterium]
MNANIYRHEFRARLRSVLVWSLALTVLTLFFFAMFPVFADQAALMNEMLAKFPQELTGCLRHGETWIWRPCWASTASSSSSSSSAWRSRPANYGFGLVSIEESELTADFLLSKPVSRTQVLTSKLLAALT